MHEPRSPYATTCQSSPLVRGAVVLIDGYRFVRKAMAAYFPPVCRFYPCCSVYAQQAFVRYGLLKGLFMAAARVLRCHPANPGGIDLLPTH